MSLPFADLSKRKGMAKIMNTKVKVTKMFEKAKEKAYNLISSAYKGILSLHEKLLAHYDSILIASFVAVEIAITALLLLDSNFRMGLLNKLEENVQVIGNAIQGFTNPVVNGLSTLTHDIARFFGGY